MSTLVSFDSAGREDRTDLVQRLTDTEGKAEKTEITHQIFVNNLFKLKMLLYNGRPANSGVLL